MLLIVITSVLLMQILASIFSPFAINIIKDKLKWEGIKAWSLALLVSIALGTFAMLLSKEWTGDNLLLNVGIVFTLSQGTYQAIKSATEKAKNATVSEG